MENSDAQGVVTGDAVLSDVSQQQLALSRVLY
jgi:hypothetical protein